MSLLYALLFALACNLDTVLLAMGFRLRGLSLSPAGSLAIAGITTAITVVSLETGRAAALLLPAGLPRQLGTLALAVMGLWFLLDGIYQPREETATLPAQRNKMGFWVMLAAALGLNNAGAGVAAGASGLHPLLGGAANLTVTVLALALGSRLGSYAGQRGGAWGRWALPVSGGLLILLGGLNLLL